MTTVSKDTTTDVEELKKQVEAMKEALLAKDAEIESVSNQLTSVTEENEVALNQLKEELQKASEAIMEQENTSSTTPIIKIGGKEYKLTIPKAKLPRRNKKTGKMETYVFGAEEIRKDKDLAKELISMKFAGLVANEETE